MSWVEVLWLIVAALFVHSCKPHEKPRAIWHIAALFLVYGLVRHFLPETLGTVAIWLVFIPIIYNPLFGTEGQDLLRKYRGN